MPSIFPRKSVKKLLESFGYEVKRIQNDKEPQPELREVSLLELAALNQANKSGDFFFVQIGANDGEMEDPLCKMIRKYGWHGILVEPVPWLFDKLVRNYLGQDGLIFENSAVGDTKTDLTLYLLSEDAPFPPSAHGLASFDRATLIKHGWFYPGIEEWVVQIQVPVITSNDLITKHQIEKIDLLQLDTEGYDWRIIKSFDFSTITPSILHFEISHMDSECQRSCFEFLRVQGYAITTIYPDAIAVHKDSLSPSSTVDQLP